MCVCGTVCGFILMMDGMTVITLIPWYLTDWWWSSRLPAPCGFPWWTSSSWLPTSLLRSRQRVPQRRTWDASSSWWRCSTSALQYSSSSLLSSSPSLPRMLPTTARVSSSYPVSVPWRTAPLSQRHRVATATSR